MNPPVVVISYRDLMAENDRRAGPGGESIRRHRASYIRTCHSVSDTWQMVGKAYCRVTVAALSVEGE